MEQPKNVCMKKLTFCLLLSFFFISIQVAADEEGSDNTGEKGFISGRVVDSENLPLPGVLPEIRNTVKMEITVQ
jgi:F420-0:gamma-glutamyl ligase-like protein